MPWQCLIQKTILQLITTSSRYFFPVIEEIPVDPVIIRIFVIDLVNTTTIKAVNLCIRVRKDYRGMGRDDELHISPGAELSQQA